MEKLSLVLPETPPYFPRQFGRCAVIGNSGDLLKTKFGKEIDGYDAVLRENGAPTQVSCSIMCCWCYFYFVLKLRPSSLSFIHNCRTTLIMWVGKARFAF